jgi:hypothetical protein
MRRECEENETSPAAANELIGEISVRLSSLERCLLAGTDIDFDPIMGLVEKLCDEARLLADQDRVSTAARLLGIVADCDSLVSRLSSSLESLRRSAAEQSDRERSLLAYARNAHGAR